MEYLFLIIGIILGLLIAWLLIAKINKHNLIPISKYTQLDKEKSILEERFSAVKQSAMELDNRYKETELCCQDLEKKLAVSQKEIIGLNEKLNYQEKHYTELNLMLSERFEKIAGDILNKNSQQISRINQERLKLILDPLKEKIQHFEKKVEETHQKQTVESNLLKKEIIMLAELNQQITIEANNLTQALKGDNKFQGNWGELVLEKVLERSGLVKGKEYFIQGEQLQLKNADGKLQKPDVVILLPDEKHIIIDAKVSLKAYEGFVNSDDKIAQEKQLKLHIQSVKTHIKILSDKYYQALDKLKSPDFVLLFIPIESSFGLAISNPADDLFNFAWDRKVVLVSPTTLLATLKTIASIWKNEKQNKNAIVIAEESGKLYDKFYSFLTDMDKIGKHLRNSQEVYDEAYKKLSSGRGNLIDKANKLKQLGINSKKTIEDIKEFDNAEDD